MSVEEDLLKKMEKRTLHFTLIDPVTTPKVSLIASTIERCGSDAILVGGSLGAFGELLDNTVRDIKSSCSLPVILFPGGVMGVSRFADAIFFLSVLNSRNSYFITKAQALGAFSVKEAGLEAIPVAYLVCEPGQTVGFMSEANLLPRAKPEIAGAYALAAKYMGFRFIYLEAGSGADVHAPPEMIGYIKKVSGLPLIVGGGITEARHATIVARAGADIIVTGTIMEKPDAEESLKKIVGALR